MSHWTDGGGQCPDGRFPDSVESASSTLVSTIEEIRNNQSISNLYYLNGSNGESPGATAGPQVSLTWRDVTILVGKSSFGGPKLSRSIFLPAEGNSLA